MARMRLLHAVSGGRRRVPVRDSAARHRDGKKCPPGTNCAAHSSSIADGGSVSQRAVRQAIAHCVLPPPAYEAACGAEPTCLAEPARFAGVVDAARRQHRQPGPSSARSKVIPTLRALNIDWLPASGVAQHVRQVTDEIEHAIAGCWSAARNKGCN
jgi:hypothetical protein